MASSKCPKCSKSSFEIVNTIPKGANYDIYLVQCSSCGTVVGTMDAYPVGRIVNEHGKTLEEIIKKLNILITKR